MEAGPIAVRVDGLLIGVRTNDRELGALLRRALRAHVEPDVDAPPNLSLKFGERAGRTRELHFLYRGQRSMVRTDSPGRLLRAVFSHLDGFASSPSATMRVQAKLLIRNGDAVLVDGRLGGNLDVVERRLDRLGYRLVDVPAAFVDRETLEVMLTAPRLDIDGDARAEIDQRYPRAPQEVEPTDSRYRLGGLVVWRWGDPGPDGQSPAQRYAELTPLIADDRDGTILPDDLDVLARLPHACHVERISDPDARALLSVLRRLSSD